MQEPGAPMTRYLPTESEIAEKGGSRSAAHQVTAHINHEHAEWVMSSVRGPANFFFSFVLL